ncbi:TlyA family RNA methyltransferase [Aureimonas sp. ME7]|uniref:TlyA family RNA methyltransferase n=1 Tax=Aureimonas sp. ME7 TaxID=2744252 RepID=UPI0015F6615E|nr:TlyA family RNA methyltransferase [Aureimonas sp. ME7]
MSAARPRLDILLADRGLLESRARARDAILRGCVRVDGVAATKPGQPTDPAARIEIEDAASTYVSRAALKLIAGLDAFEIDCRDRQALDVGASTGGFTQVLLERGAASVVSLDVGHDQLHPSLRADPRVRNIEGLNARALTEADLAGAAIDLVVSDVSFISLKLALPPALTLAQAESHAVLLVKPQFEAGREAIGKGGLLRDPAIGPDIADDLSRWFGSQPGWHSLGWHPSPIKGGDGNVEFLLAGRKT